MAPVVASLGLGIAWALIFAGFGLGDTFALPAMLGAGAVLSVSRLLALGIEDARMLWVAAFSLTVSLPAACIIALSSAIAGLLEVSPPLLYGLAVAAYSLAFALPCQALVLAVEAVGVSLLSERRALVVLAAVHVGQLLGLELVWGWICAAGHDEWLMVPAFPLGLLLCAAVPWLAEHAVTRRVLGETNDPVQRGGS